MIAQTNDRPLRKKPVARANQDKIFVRPTKLTARERAKRAKLLKLLHEWAADNSGEQERSWAITEKMLKQNALSKRNRSDG